VAISRRVSLRVGLYGGAVAALGGLLFWPRGRDVRDGRHDRRHNGLWLQHGWLGDDLWFSLNDREHKKAELRADASVLALRGRLDEYGIHDVFPHLCPAQPDGSLLPVDRAATKRFLSIMAGKRVMPWIGGVLELSAHPERPEWRRAFVASALALLTRYPSFAGVHVNIEPCPSGHAGFLSLLDELGAALPAGKLLSVAAFAPPSLLHPFDDVHWSEAYYREVAKRAHQLVPMLYDTSLHFVMPYRGLVASWAQEVLEWSEGCEVLLGLPAFDDRDVGYHDPEVENLEHALAGVHAALHELPDVPATYRGVAIYADWTMDEAKWRILSDRFSDPSTR
jgi:hypothetical protein